MEFPIRPTAKRPGTSSRPTQPNAFRNAQVLPPHKVDLTLAPTTQEQMRASPNIINHTRH
ncbi:hypothetical protein SAMN05216228_104318 [Rhizobium tibeticum]|uniref:Uncharacterized protein n=1 Tax=Rhizobium tibeticum TaxID=501024 RepID=A0A1H8VIT1_9HYPH|nr:hypothetical protein RTCCBAU85039_6067 [Rhizobium tibeticum]SEP15281.1 hypothetical protein SAMN05216228_104318 [Rhizobium tibeticum]